MEKDNKTLAEVSKEHKIAQTYASDMAGVIENDTQGLVKKIIHEEEESQAEKQNLSPQSRKNKTFMFLGIFLIILSLIILSYFVFLKKDNNTVGVESQLVPIIFNDKSTFFEVSGFKKDEITQTVLNQINNTKVRNGGVEGIYLTENNQIVGLQRFIALIKSSFIPSDNKILVSDNFMMGVVNGNTDSPATSDKGFFVLLKVRSTPDIFDSLRAWENKMFFDLHGFLGINISSDTNYLLVKNFDDAIIENKNARVLYDKDGKIIVMYVFADDNSVIITNSQNATHEIILRLASSQKKQ